VIVCSFSALLASNAAFSPSARTCVLFSGVVWCGVVWCSVVWCGVGEGEAWGRAEKGSGAHLGLHQQVEAAHQLLQRALRGLGLLRHLAEVRGRERWGREVREREAAGSLGLLRHLVATAPDPCGTHQRGREGAGEERARGEGDIQRERQRGRGAPRTLASCACVCASCACAAAKAALAAASSSASWRARAASAAISESAEPFAEAKRADSSSTCLTRRHRQEEG